MSKVISDKEAKRLSIIKWEYLSKEGIPSTDTMPKELVGLTYECAFCDMYNGMSDKAKLKHGVRVKSCGACPIRKVYTKDEWCGCSDSDNPYNDYSNLEEFYDDDPDITLDMLKDVALEMLEVVLSLEV